jgi:mRNA interferase RelE/StbE
MVWTVDIEHKAKRQLDKLGHQARCRILNYLYEQVQPRDDPRELGKALRHDKSGLWRYRVDKYCIICKIEDEVLVIVVVKIGKRDSVYE